ncbi:maltose ABC transporter permease MalG [Natronospora cellulosivora (SeqCode)]
MNKSKSSILKHIIILLAIAFTFFPIIWVISASFNPSNTLVGQSLIPREISFSHYREMFTSTQHPFMRWLWNSLKISLITSVLAVSLTTLAAYPFSRFRFKYRQKGLFIILLVQVFPQMLAMVAIYLLFLNLQRYFPSMGLNTHLALIITYLGGAVGINTWLMKGYMDTIPRSLEEAAYIDGASKFQAFTVIILPLIRPMLVVIFILQFIASYSEYMMARILLGSSSQYTLAVGLHLFITDQYGARWGVFSASAIVGAIPIILIFLLLQDQIVSGLTGGAVKG